MAKKYLVRAGFSFRAENGAVVGGGEQIELEDDVANDHLHKLELVEDKPARKAPAKKAAEGAAETSDPAAGAGEAGATTDPQ